MQYLHCSCCGDAKQDVNGQSMFINSLPPLSVLDSSRMLSSLLPTETCPATKTRKAQLIEDALCPPDDAVEVALSNLVGLESVKNQIRGLRHTIEFQRLTPGSSQKLPMDLALQGNSGTRKLTVAEILSKVMFKIGVVQNRNYFVCGREDLIDRKLEARTIFKMRKALEHASGGVLVLDEAYTLLPSTARPRGCKYKT